MRHTRAITRTMAGLCGGTVVVLVAAYAVLLVAGYKPAAVYSGSMTPTLRVGSLVFDRVVPSEQVRVGDVITFNDPSVDGRFVTHRVVKIIPTQHGLAYRTKGDANPDRDPWTIRLTGKVGRVSFQVPVAGYLLFYAHTREVRGLLIVIASLLALTTLLRRIWRNETAPALGEGRK